MGGLFILNLILENDMTIGVIGVGNILLMDEGVGPKVVEILQKNYNFEPEIEIIDGLSLIHI